MIAYRAIETRYHGPTNYRGSRYSASDEGRRIYVDVPAQLSGVECHAYAARKLAEKLEWAGTWYGGGTKAGYVFVLVSKSADAAAFVVVEPTKEGK